VNKNKYKAMSSSDNLLLGKIYLGYDDGNTVTLTHVEASKNVIQLHNPIRTIINNVEFVQ
jgi:hypothetical protein